jgi:hypothetical protein
VILGATKLSQLEDNFGALKCATNIDPTVLSAIEAVLDNAPLVHDASLIASLASKNASVDWNPNPSLKA